MFRALKKEKSVLLLRSRAGAPEEVWVVAAIFVVTVVMGDFLTIGIMGGQQLASVGKIINTEMNYLQFPGAAANAVILLIITIFIIYVMTKFIDIRKEL